MQAPPGTIEIGHARLPARYDGNIDADRVVILASAHGVNGDDGATIHEADLMRQRGLATLRMALLRDSEQPGRRVLYDIDLLADRVADGIDWIRAQARGPLVQIGLAGSGTVAAGLLRAAARCPGPVGAVVCRSGRPDLAAHSLGAVEAATLLIVGGRDPLTRGLNRGALGRLGGHGTLAVVPGASHGFGEAGLLHHAALLAAHWMDDHLARAAGTCGPSASPQGLSPLKPASARPSTVFAGLLNCREGAAK